MSILTVFFAFQFGLVMNNGIPVWDYTLSNSYDGQQEYYTYFEAGMMFYDIAYVKGSVETRVYSKEWNSNVPVAMIYEIEAGIQYEGWKIAFYHMCQHPMMVFAEKEYLNYINNEGGYEKLYIEYSTKLDVF